MASLLNTCSVLFFICFLLYALAEPPYKPGENEWFSNDPLTLYYQKLMAKPPGKPCNGTTTNNNNNNNNNKNNRGAPVPTKDLPQPQKMMKLKMKPKTEVEEKKEGQ
ncbi:hypothetical protein niasHT_019036 [Heterodera trifolii]|uniref:Uncharacterized protein n=1 Tax=Heterodera trifolii TaxID=157864 RepID=A0ABD2LJ81_9BILA